MGNLLDKPTVAGYLLTIAALVIVIAGLNKAASLIVPFLLAVFVAVLCAPILFWLKSKKIPTALSILIIVFGAALIGVVIFAIIGTSLNDFSRTMPLYQAKITAKSHVIVEWLDGMGFKVTDKDFSETLNPGAAMQLVTDMLVGLKNVLTKGFLIMLTVIFILLECSTYGEKLKAIFDDPELAFKSFRTFTLNIQSYIVIKTLTSLVTGILVTVWLLILGVDYPLLFGFLAFLLNFIPTIGSILAAIPAILLTSIQLGTGHVIAVAVGYMVINVIIGNIVEPKVMGKGLGLSTLVVFLSLVFWGAIFGPVGMLLSVPLTMSVKIALDTRDETRWIAVMLGS